MTRAQVLVGDCLQVMATMEACSVDAIVTDPPYELGFMGKSWDASGVAFRVEVWREALRVLKPGGHLLAFSGSRTYHRMAVAIEDAGFEIRDQIMWVYGSGFPKSLDVSKAIDAAAGAEREVVGSKIGIPGYSLAPDRGRNVGAGHDGTLSNPHAECAITAPATPDARRWQGWGTALKPAHEPIVVARKPLIGTVAANVLAHGTGALNIDGCRVGTEVETWPASRSYGRSTEISFTSSGDKLYRAQATGPAPPGRWPANLIHDGSEEIEGFFPGDDGASAARFFYSAKASKRDRDEGLNGFSESRRSAMGYERGLGHLGEGMFKDRNPIKRNIHPTVKPTDLMRYLCRLVTPPGGLVLDPFTGSGSTGKGAVMEGFRFVGIELSPEYAAIARARIQHALGYLEPQPVAQDAQDDVPTGQLRLFA